LRDKLDVDVTVIELFQNPTVRTLSEHLTNKGQAGPEMFTGLEDRAKLQLEARKQRKRVRKQRQ
jgi:hypothetical protein